MAARSTESRQLLTASSTAAARPFGTLSKQRGERRSLTRCTVWTGTTQELSKHLENIMIIAPSERISPTQTYGLWGDYNGERILNGGHWNVYKNGKQISSLNSSDVWNQNY